MSEKPDRLPESSPSQGPNSPDPRRLGHLRELHLQALIERDRLSERLLAAQDEIADLKSGKRALEAELSDVQHAAGRHYRTVQRNGVQLEAAYWQAKLMRARSARRNIWRRAVDRIAQAIAAARLAFGHDLAQSSEPKAPVAASPLPANLAPQEPSIPVEAPSAGALRHSRETVLAPLPGFATQGRDSPRFTLAVLIFGLEEARVADILERIGVQLSHRPNFAPVFITDCKAFALFRREGYSFEYLPGAADWDRLAPDLDWSVMLRQRAELLRAKWWPEAVVAFGKKPPHLMDVFTHRSGSMEPQTNKAP